LVGCARGGDKGDRDAEKMGTSVQRKESEEAGA